jgi:hypothetical protein
MNKFHKQNRKIRGYKKVKKRYFSEHLKIFMMQISIYRICNNFDMSGYYKKLHEDINARHELLYK